MAKKQSSSVKQDKLKVLDQQQGNGYVLINGDSCEAIKGIPDNSIDLTVSSPPFENLYTYSPSPRDMGNNPDSLKFFEHFDFLIQELYRVTTPGRLAVMHCKDLPLYKGRDGAAGLRDFPGDIIRAFEKHGWVFHSRVTIWKDPVTEMQRTKNNGLLHKTLCRDTSQSRQGMADYLIVMRKWSGEMEGLMESTKPVTRGSELVRFSEYIGEEGPTRYKPGPSPYAGEWWSQEDCDRQFSIDVWQRYASPVWFDINQTNVLNSDLSREPGDERHICPLQLDLIARCVELWSNPGDVVFDPFNGVGSTGYESLKMGRNYIGIELKPSYFKVACQFLSVVANDSQQQLDLLDLLSISSSAA